MAEQKTPQGKFWQMMTKRVVPLFVLLYLIVALVCAVLVPIVAVRWINQPFLGVYVGNTLVLSQTGPAIEDSWQLYKFVDQHGYQIQSLDGEKITSFRQFANKLAAYPPGSPVSLEVDNRKTEAVESVILTTNLQSFPLDDQLASFYLPYFIGVVFLLCSLWVYATRQQDLVGQVFVVFTASVSMLLTLYFDSHTTSYFTWLWTVGLFFSSTALLNMTFLYPVESVFLLRRVYLVWLSFLPCAILSAVGGLVLYNINDPFAYVSLWRVAYALLVVSVVCFVVAMVIRQFRFVSPVAREQTRLTLIGALVSFGPVAFWMLATMIWNQITFRPWLFLFVAIFPVIMAYSILRYRVVKADYWVSRAVLYSVMFVLAALGYALLTAGATLIVGTRTPISSPYLLGAAAFLLALLFHPLRSFILRRVDVALNRSNAVYQEQLQAFGHQLTQVMDLPLILEQLRKTVNLSLVPATLHIFVQDVQSDRYVAAAANDGRPTSDLRFSFHSALVQMLTERRSSIFIGEGAALPATLVPDQARLALLGARVYVPMMGRQRLTGWLALGGRTSGEPYNNLDIQFLESLCDQAALAVERAQVMEDLERRMHAMNVLTRVSQGINITLAFDDMLELIYAQTNQVIPTRDFRLTLRDNFSDLLYHVFCLENDDRLIEKENRLLPSSQGLEQEVVRNRRTIATDDYERECRSRGITPAIKGKWYAWLGVPLNAGAETIGVVSVASRDPAVVYTTEQVNLLQAIADQTAGAIVKARLLQETERRARQLTSLNEVARSLTSTLDIGLLLNQILQSAVSILNCEAGSLLMVDQQTEELVFEVVVGPVDLQGQRLPPGTGLVGKAVEGREPIIANDARRTKEWYDKDEETGFTTKDLLVVPMQVKERVIGVIEVINRKDGLPFTPSDQELLNAFTSQAAIAIENARLYTQTDQSLAARVEELSVMQRIDRELNASLDIERAMRITLEWAMRQSHVDAGFIGVLVEGGIRVMASQGYGKELEPYQQAPMPMDLPAVSDAIQNGQPQYLHVGNGHAGRGKPLLKNSKSQIALPIQQESHPIGIMLLESLQEEDSPSEIVDFLSRLVDHAAIAIANAQLYNQVDAANQAKVEFVKFVAHELKNPMSSIKGYTELVLNGAAGTVNDMQAQFLKTVRSNVDRMDTIVSDLNDVTKIESGKLDLKFNTIQVTDVIDDAARSLTRLIGDKHQQLVFELQDNLPMIWADPIRLTQIIVNLVSNAHKYTPQEGQIIVGARVIKDKQGAAADVSFVHIWVKDNGIGISPEDQKKIFQQYFRTTSSKEMASGTGLGLNITKSLVEMQGGRIWFDSELHVGTTFHITVPVAEAG
jgi:signal transduction histidine kinase/signal transduction protein with GAF and PtsI domain